MSNESNNSSTSNNSSNHNFLDKRLIATLAKLNSRLNGIKELLDKCFENDLYSNASHADRVTYDLFLAYASTSLFWTYLRTLGIDPHQHPVKQEVERIKSYMTKAKTVHDRHLRPKIDQPASKRFVRNALWTPSENENIANEESRKRKRDKDVA
ncbi:ribosomal RNA processing 47 [Lycorma delicatula]|uniref:ribosomal RNA processing 47 n=1 Tax=Lycorma delicatula TaxID=130591 RepID=UPI003F514A0F